MIVLVSEPDGRLKVTQSFTKNRSEKEWRREGWKEGRKRKEAIK